MTSTTRTATSYAVPHVSLTCVRDGLPYPIRDQFEHTSGAKWYLVTDDTGADVWMSERAARVITEADLITAIEGIAE